MFSGHGSLGVPHQITVAVTVSRGSTISAPPVLFRLEPVAVCCAPCATPDRRRGATSLSLQSFPRLSAAFLALVGSERLIRPPSRCQMGRASVSFKFLSFLRLCHRVLYAVLLLVPVAWQAPSYFEGDTLKPFFDRLLSVGLI